MLRRDKRKRVALVHTDRRCDIGEAYDAAGLSLSNCLKRNPIRGCICKVYIMSTYLRGLIDHLLSKFLTCLARGQLTIPPQLASVQISCTFDLFQVNLTLALVIVHGLSTWR
jgi:hypothetical protein